MPFSYLSNVNGNSSSIILHQKSDLAVSIYIRQTMPLMLWCILSTPELRGVWCCLIFHPGKLFVIFLAHGIKRCLGKSLGPNQ